MVGACPKAAGLLHLRFAMTGVCGLLHLWFAVAGVRWVASPLVCSGGGYLPVVQTSGKFARKFVYAYGGYMP